MAGGGVASLVGQDKTLFWYVRCYTKCLHPHHPYRDPPPLYSLGCTLSPQNYLLLIFPHKRYLHHSQDPVQRKSKAIAEHSKYFSFQNRAVLNTLRAHLHLVIKVYFYYKDEHNWENATRARTKTKNLPNNEISAATRINLESCQSNKTCYSKPTKTSKILRYSGNTWLKIFIWF